MALTAEQAEYLKSHLQAILGTGRRDGSPQLSTINYLYDGSHVYISVTSERAKWRNARRQPRVALLVPDGHKQLVIYGTVEGIPGGKPRNDAIRAIRERMGNPLPPEMTDEDFGRRLDELKRVVLKITPERAFLND